MTSWNEINEILLLSLWVSGSAVFIAALTAIPLGGVLAMRRFPGKGFIINLCYTLLGLPPVVVGVWVYLVLSRSGPLGNLQLLFTPGAMIIAQVILVFPIILSLTYNAINNNKDRLLLQLKSLGASPRQVMQTILWESRPMLVVAVFTGLGRALAEVGAVMIVGGNIKSETRVMTTAIVLETRQGNMETALVLGSILLGMAFMIILVTNSFFKGEVGSGQS